MRSGVSKSERGICIGEDKSNVWTFFLTKQLKALNPLEQIHETRNKFMKLCSSVLWRDTRNRLGSGIGFSKGGVWRGLF